MKMGWSRRKVSRAIAAGMPAAILFRVAPARASEKMTRQQAEYRDMPNGIYSLRNVHAVRTAVCKVVEGEVSKDGWCKAFAVAD